MLLLQADAVIWSGDSAGGLGATDSVDWVLDFLRNTTEDHFASGALFGAPIGGFYYSNNWPYNGTSPPPVNYIPWSYDAMKVFFFPDRRPSMHHHLHSMSKAAEL